MNKRFLMTIVMNLSLISQVMNGWTPHQAAIATGITTLGIATGSYMIFKKKCKKLDFLERCGLTAVVTAPLSYIASVLWFGLTPEMRFTFARETADNNDSCSYATREYKSIELLLEDVGTNYGSYAWLVDLHEDMVRALTKTRSAMRKWTLAQEEESVATFSWIDNDTYRQLQKHSDCLEHNLLLLRRYRPFQDQHNAWISTHTCHYACR